MGRRTETNTASAVTKRTEAQVNYLLGILADEIDPILYEKNWRIRKRVAEILSYYGLEEDVDYEVIFSTNFWGNREISIRWYWDKEFHDSSWDNEDDEWWHIYSTMEITQG